MANKHMEPLGDEWAEEAGGSDPTFEYIPKKLMDEDTEKGMAEMLGSKPRKLDTHVKGVKCSGCRQMIDGPAFTHRKTGDIYHRQCFNGLLSCHKCSKDIIGATVTTETGLNFHQRCFKCENCSNLIGSAETYKEGANGEVFCRNCMKGGKSNNDEADDFDDFDENLDADSTKKAKNTKRKGPKSPAASFGGSGSSSGRGSTSKRGTARGGAGKATPAQKQKVYDKVQEGKDYCTSCNKVIGPGSVVNAKGKLYHGDCFTCGRCNEVITGGFQTKAGTNYCKDCALAMGPKCADCGKPLEGKFVKVDGETLHMKCWKKRG